MYVTLDVSKIRPVLSSNSLRFKVVIGGWGIYMYITAPRAISIQKLESRNPDFIEKEEFFKFLVISKDITLMDIS